MHDDNVVVSDLTSNVDSWKKTFIFSPFKKVFFYIISYPIKIVEFTVSLFMVVQSPDRIIVNISAGFILYSTKNSQIGLSKGKQ